MAERRTHAEWVARLMDPAARLTLDEFHALETYYAAGALMRFERSWMQTQPDIRRLSLGYADMFSVWLVAAVRAVIRHVPGLRWLPPYPDSLVGRMDLKEAQAIVALEIERRQEIVDGAVPQAELLARLQVSGGGRA